MSLLAAYIDFSEESDEEDEGYDDWPLGLGDWDASDDYHEPYDYYWDPLYDCHEVPNSQQSNHTNLITFLLKYNSIIKRALKWGLFKWIFIVLNVVIEVCQATFTQENAIGKISRPLYMKLSVVTSCLCLMISLVEAIHEGKESKVVWQRRGCYGWFYYPGRQRRIFGRFSLVFGVVSSMVQLCINLVALVINKNFLKFETLPLLLSIGYLVAALVGHGGKDMVKCEVHGRCVEECSGCKVDASV